MKLTEPNCVRRAEGATVVAPALFSSDSRVARAVEEYLALLKSGQSPDREAFLARDPAIAEALAECLEGLEFIHMAASGLQQVDAEGRTSSPLSFGEELPQALPLGDYQIVRQVGRGGMGIVYEAVQLSLGRRVALKILPLAAALDARQLQRFKSEAITAAHLHHPHIVPVYAVGYDRGVHYYAMQFIEGKTLGDFIEGFRQLTGLAGSSLPSTRPAPLGVPSIPGEPDLSSTRPDPPSPPKPVAPDTVPTAGLATERSIQSRSFFRTAAQLGIQAAEALEQAHQVGVVHRDIKPANLLVDLAGKLWITDFGLARFRDNPDLTFTGDLLGTWRYMSPEQAAAKRVLVDHRTDIYSLGVTLYELLTLAPPFESNDRQELLQQIACEEPRAPRRMNPAIPVELETIVLKAIAKRPEERYATAQELADDLERFLEDKPVQARRPSARERLVKWSRRHKPIVAAAAITLVLAVVFLSISTILAWRSEQHANVASKVAEDALQAQKEQQEATTKDLNVMLQAFDGMLRHIRKVSPWVSRDSRMRQEHQAELVKLIASHKALANAHSADPNVRLTFGNAYMTVGWIQLGLGELTQAATAYDQALAIFNRLALDQPSEEARFALASCHHDRALLFRDASRIQDAEQSLKEAMDLYQGLLVDFPPNPWVVFWLEESRHELSALLFATGRPQEAEAALRQALPILERLHRQVPGCPICQTSLTDCLDNLGLILEKTGRAGEAEKNCRRALDLLNELTVRINAPTFPAELLPMYEDLSIPERTAIVGKHLGSLLHQAGRLEESEKAHLQSLEALKALAAGSPGSPDLQEELGSAQCQLGIVLAERGHAKDAEQACAEALKLLQPLVADYPTKQDYQKELGDCWNALGHLLESSQKHPEAEADYRQAVSIFEKLAEKFPSIQEYQTGLRASQKNLERLLKKHHKELGRP